MNRLLLACLLLISFSPAKAQNWVKVFDGQTTTGWHVYKKPGQANAWKVRDGELYLDVNSTDAKGDLVTDEVYEDFEMKFDWKVDAGKNSGVIFFVQEDDAHEATWHSGPEFQLIDNDGYPNQLKPNQLAGSLYDLIACPAGIVKKAGEWNTTVIRVKGDKLDFIINGKKAVSTKLWDDKWYNMVAESKFVEFKDFAANKKGRIALQDHGGGAYFKNIMIRKL